MRVSLRTPSGDATIRLPMLGEWNGHNAALAAALVEGARPGQGLRAFAALERFPGVPGRMERVQPRGLVDYAHTPEAVERAVAEAKRGTPAPLVVVLGCGGERDPGKRPLMAGAALSADHVVLTSDNPRGEAPEAILDDMARTLPPATRPGGVIQREADRGLAIERALTLAEDGGREGTVLLLGKGHEATQTIGAVAWHFDDREELRRRQRARSEGCAPEDAPLAWGWWPEELDAQRAATRAIREARARRGGLWVVRAAPEGREPGEAAALRPPPRWRPDQDEVLVATLDEVAARLTPRHRRLLCLAESADWPAELTCDADRAAGDPWPHGDPPHPNPPRPRLPALDPPEVGAKR